MRPGEARVGRYLLLRELARGGMGVVYEAQSPEGGRVALKVLLDPARPDALARFERERRLLAELSAAPGFVPLLDAGQHQGRPWLVMSFMEGGSLRERIDRGPMSVDAAVELGHQLATAIGRAHARGIVHRDLKPENVLFERLGDAAPRIADLGVAKHFRREGVEAAASVSLSRSGTMLGTACYMAPEQLKDARSVGPPADVFALAQIVYECVAGTTPFRGESLTETLTLLIEGRPVPLRERVPGVPAWLDAALARALQTDPAERWADGRAFARALALGERAVLDGRDRRAGSAGSGRLIAGAALGLGGLVALGAAVVTGGVDAPAPVASAPAASPTTTGQVASPATEVTPPVPAEDPSARLDRQVREAARAGEDGARDQAVALADAVLAEAPDHVGARAVRRLFGEGLARAELDALIAETAAPFLLAARAQAHLEANDAPAALEDVQRALAAEPPNAWRLTLRADAWIRLGESELARRDAEAAVALRPDLVLGWVVLSSARRGLGDLTGGVEAAREAVRLAPEDVEALVGLGSSLLEAGQNSEAWDVLDRAVALRPDSAGALAARGTARSLLGRTAEGRVDLERAVALGYDEPSTLHNLGVHYVRERDWVAARDVASRLIARHPRDPRGYGVRGMARHELGDLPGARVDLDRLLELDPGASLAHPWAKRAVLELVDVAPGVDPGPHEGLSPADDHQARASMLHEFALAAVNANDPARVVELCTQALALVPDHAELLALRGTFRHGAEGLPDLDRAIEVGPAKAYMFVNRSDRRAMIDDLRGAIDDMDRALALEAPSGFRLVRRADLRRRAGDLPGAIDDLRAALTLDAADAAAWKFLAHCLRLTGQLDPALEAAREATALGARDDMAWAELALVHVARREWSEALAAAERALAITPRLSEALRARGLAREGLGDAAGALADLEQLVPLEGRELPADVQEALARLRPRSR